MQLKERKRKRKKKIILFLKNVLNFSLWVGKLNKTKMAEE
jgi:hypothetical protein